MRRANFEVVHFANGRLCLVRGVNVSHDVLRCIAVLDRVEEDRRCAVRPRLIQVCRFIPRATFANAKLFNRLFTGDVRHRLVAPISHLFVGVRWGLSNVSVVGVGEGVFRNLCLAINICRAIYVCFYVVVVNDIANVFPFLRRKFRRRSIHVTPAELFHFFCRPELERALRFQLDRAFTPFSFFNLFEDNDAYARSAYRRR